MVLGVTGIEKQKSYFDRLYDTIISPIKVAKNYREHNIFRPGKQYYLDSKGCIYPPYDHRSIGENEIVMDFDAPSFSKNVEYARKVVEYLNDMEIPHYIFWSGNKGVHCHIFLDALDSELEKVNKGLMKDYGESMLKECRIYIAKDIILNSGLDISIYGKVIDSQKIEWTASTLIRCCGGANIKVNKLTGDEEAHYFKTWLEVLEKKPKLDKFSDVEYPPTIECYHLTAELINKVLGDIASRSDKKLKYISERIDYGGKYMSLPCIRQIMEGMESGDRSKGACQIAFACKLDGIELEEAKKIIQIYAKNCSQIPEPYHESEAIGWINYAYNTLTTPYFSCACCRKLGVCESMGCEYDEEKNKEIVEYYKGRSIWDDVKEYLDLVIAGENDSKMMLFLLLLTKPFNQRPFIQLHGESSSGKTYMAQNVLRLFGELDKDYRVVSRITDSAFNYLNDDYFYDKIIFITELQGIEEGSQLRVLISEGKLNLVSVEKQKNEDGVEVMATTEKSVEAKNCCFLSCQAEEHNEFDSANQMATRSFIINTDSSIEQTERVIDHINNRLLVKKVEGGEVEVGEDLRQRILSFMKSLKVPKGCVISKEVCDLIKEYLPKSECRIRRDYERMIYLLYGVCMINQHNRVWDGDCLELKAEDFEIALRKFKGGKFFTSSMQGLGDKDLEYLKVVEEKLGSNLDISFSKKDIINWCGISESNCRKVISQLIKAGFVENRSSGGKVGEYYLLKLSDASSNFDILVDKVSEYI